MADRKLTVSILGDASSLERAFKKAGRSSDTFGSKVKRNLKFAALGAGAGGLALLGRGLVDSTKAALEAEKAQTRLESALKGANVSYAKQGKAIEKAIDKTSKLAALDDEELSDAFAKLVRTTGSVTKATEGMALAADLARARNISLEAATKIVEKAHVGQLRGLKGVGVEIGKNTTSTQALERAQKKFAGSAARYGKTAAGAQDKLSVAFENLQEKVGSKVLPVLQKFALRLVEVIDSAEKNWPRFRKAIDPVVKAIRDLGPVTAAMFKIVRPILEFWFGKVLPAQLAAAAGAIKLFADAVRVLGSVFGTVFSGILRASDKFLAGFQAVLEGLSKIPFLGDRFKGVAESIGRARDQLQGLTTQLDNLRGKTVQSTVTTRTLNTLEDNRTTLRAGSAPPPGQRRLAVAGGVTFNFHGDIVTPNPDAFIRDMEKRAQRSSVGRR